MAAASHADLMLITGYPKAIITNDVIYTIEKCKTQVTEASGKYSVIW